MINKKVVLVLGIMLVVFVSFSFISALSVQSGPSNVVSNSGNAFSNPSGFSNPAGSTSFNNPVQFQQPNFNSYYTSSQIATYWPILSNMQNGSCQASSDFIVNIRPGSCQPMVVTSDLLEEQNVPIFCQLDAIRLNPLISVSSIKSISFSGKYPDGVAGISFHPARAAIKSYRTLLGSPVLNNIGYVVIVLKKNAVESKMPDYVSGNLTATIQYDSENAYGTGKSEFYLPQMTDDEWETSYADSSFWLGKGFLRVNSIQGNTADISLYTDKDHSFREVNLEVGKESSLIYFPGFYCQAGLKIKLNSITSSDTQARLNIDGQEFWVRQGSKILNDKCSVSSINAMSDGTGSIVLSCAGSRVSLSLRKSSVSLDSGSGEASYKIGERVAEGNIKNINYSLYLGYVGTTNSNIVNSRGVAENANFVVLVDSKKDLTNTQTSDILKRVSDLSGSGTSSSQKTTMSLDDFKKKIESSSGWSSGLGKVFVVYQNSAFTNGTFNIVFKGNSQSQDAVYGDARNTNTAGGMLENYFASENTSVSEILSGYPTEQGNLQTFGEQALLDEIYSAERIGKQQTSSALMKVFLEKYPSSSSAAEITRKLGMYSTYDYSFSSASVLVNNDYHSLIVESFKLVDKSSRGVLLSVGGVFDNYAEGDIIGLGDNKNASSAYLLLKKINISDALFEWHYKDKNDKWIVDSNLIDANEKSSFLKSGKSIYVSQINFNQVAYVSLNPVVQNTNTGANFSFSIGIEKRAIQLSPDATKQKIANINATIEKWQSINDKLTNLVKGWKGACFATSAALMIKSVASGFNGESMARQEVMKSYREKCAIDPQYKGMSSTECYNKLATSINNDVNAMTKAITATNNDIIAIQNKYKTDSGDLLTGPSIDTSKFIADYKTSLKTTYPNGVPITVDGQTKYVEIDSIENVDQLRDVERYNQLKGSGASADLLNASQKALSSELYPVYNSQQSKTQIKTINSRLSESLGMNDSGVLDLDISNAKQVPWTGKTYTGDIKENNNGNVPIQVVHYKGKDYMLTLEGSTTGGNLHATNVYDVTSGKPEVVSSDNKDAKELMGSYSFISSGSCKNKYLTPKLQYYESDPNKGLPAIVPFDLVSGWYAKVPQSTGSVLSNTQKGYQSSGAVSFFYICNVGSNGLAQDMGGDDICQSFDVNTMNKVNSFSGCSLSASSVQQLATKAQEAIRQAAQQYGKKTASILGQTMETGLPLTSQQFECQDFMSPEECKLLFNVCDPVICPTSRCNLGGSYPVADVVQTGIIGSIMLCLPNFKEGILIPVCLTGINAGLDSFISILKSGRDCLQKSLDSGEHVGVCDEITSVYLCEFFWRQFAPVMNIIIPKMIESAYGQGTRGGGEYLTVAHSWDSLQNSISYFKDNYAQTSFKAFQVKSVEEAGGTFCRAFIGSNIPSLNALIEPESPSQFYAWFSEASYSDATVPSTSKYKVYYHIYAGKDSGSQYAIYLKDPPASSYYTQNAIVNVKTGYINKGGSADETVDFTAPSGYKQLCVVIGSQENCGFKSVSTDFGLQYLQKQYVATEATKTGITTEKECISGSPSVLALANPNIQAGVQDTIQPSIAMQGIVRICSTNNPGISSDVSGVNNSRWVRVGTCGNSNIGCWLDSDSVKTDISQLNAIDKTLGGTGSLMQTMYDNNSMTSEDSAAQLAIAREDIRKLSADIDNLLKFKGNSDVGSLRISIEERIVNLTNNLNIISTKGYLNTDKAEALKLRADVYRIIVLSVFDNLNPAPIKQESVVVTRGSSISDSTTGSIGLSSDGSISYFSEGDSVVNIEDDRTWTRDANGVWKSEGLSSNYSDLEIQKFVDLGTFKMVDSSLSSSSSSTSSGILSSIGNAVSSVVNKITGKTGFTYNSDNYIIYNGKNTKMHLNELDERKYLILQEKVSSSVGTIIDEKIDITINSLKEVDGIDDIKSVASDLKNNYKFDGTNFIKK